MGLVAAGVPRTWPLMVILAMVAIIAGSPVLVSESLASPKLYFVVFLMPATRLLAIQSL